jgi:hypothetical protein
MGVRVESIDLPSLDHRILSILLSITNSILERSKHTFIDSDMALNSGSSMPAGGAGTGGGGMAALAASLDMGAPFEGSLDAPSGPVAALEFFLAAFGFGGMVD